MVLRIDNVSLRFGMNVACNDVSLEVGEGEIVALLGENGAGKSTLLSIVAGFVAPDAGTVRVDGEVVRLGDPGSAMGAGIGTAFQHFSLAPELRVGESLELARIDPAGASGRLAEGVPLDAKIGDLTVPERQQVEFLKARMIARRVLLLDEPTSLLGDADVDRVLQEIREVAAGGTACVFVTHRLHEAIAVADRIVVMRHGYVVERLTRPETDWPPETRQLLLAAMFGDAWVSETGEYGDTEVDSTPAGTDGQVVVHGIPGQTPNDISLERGRVLAVAGIAGNGQQELVELISGPATRSVSVRSNGHEQSLSGAALRAWIAAQLAVVPEDRFHEGGSETMSLAENLVLRDLVAGRLSRWMLVGTKRVRERARQMIGRWDIRPSDPTVRFGTLSGGNAQRVLLARSLDPLPQVLVAVRPTHGLDHHSTEMVRAQLREAARAGTAVVSIEQELDEALRHADMVAVMYRGRLSPIIPVAQADRSQLQGMMVSGWDA